MALSQELQAKLNVFNAKYGIEFDLENMENNYRKLAYMDNFMFNAKPEAQREADIFFKMVKTMMLASFEARTTLSATNSNYTVGDFNIETFVNEMEELVTERNLEYDEPRERKEYAGAKYSSLIANVKKAAEPYNKTIYGIWATKVLNSKDNLSFYDLKELTDPATERIQNGMEQQNYLRSDLANVVYAREAMAMVRAQRTRWWKFWHPIDNYREKAYLKDLTAKVEAYKATSHLPVKHVLDACESLLKNAYGKGVVKEKNVSIDKKLDKIIDDPHLKEELIPEIIAALPEPTAASSKSLQGTMLNTMLDDIRKEMSRQNQLYFDAIAGEGDQETAMEELVGTIFDQVNSMIGMLGYDKPQDALVASQLLLDVLLNKMSPVAVDPELAKYAQGYVLNNANKFTKYTYHEMGDEVMVAATEAFNKMTSKDKNENEVVNEDVNNKNEDKQVNKEEPAVNQQPASTAPDLKDPEFVDKFIKEMVEELPDMKGNYEYKDKVGLREILKDAKKYIGDLPKAIEDANQAYADGVAAGTDTTQLMKEYMNNMAPAITEIGREARYGESNLTLSMIQMMTDYVMKNYSPAAQNPEQWKDFAEGYYLKDLYEFSGVSAYQGFSAMSESKTAPAKYEELKEKKATAEPDMAVEPEILPVYKNDMPIHDQVNPIVTAPGFAEKFLEDLVKILPDNNFKIRNKDEKDMKERLMAFNGEYIKDFGERIGWINTAFDEGRKQDKDLKELQKEYVFSLKHEVSNILQRFVGGGAHEDNARKQIVTEYILKRYTPAAAAPEEWKEVLEAHHYEYGRDLCQKYKLEMEKLEQEQRHEKQRQAREQAKENENQPEIEKIVVGEAITDETNVAKSQRVSVPSEPTVQKELKGN